MTKVTPQMLKRVETLRVAGYIWSDVHATITEEFEDSPSYHTLQKRYNSYKTKKKGKRIVGHTISPKKHESERIEKFIETIDRLNYDVRYHKARSHARKQEIEELRGDLERLTTFSNAQASHLKDLGLRTRSKGPCDCVATMRVYQKQRQQQEQTSTTQETRYDVISRFIRNLKLNSGA